MQSSFSKTTYKNLICQYCSGKNSKVKCWFQGDVDFKTTFYPQILSKDEVSERIAEYEEKIRRKMFGGDITPGLNI